MIATRILVGTVVAALSATSTAAAQTDDPSAGSPPGVVYQLPLDRARSDAAPNTADSSGSNRNGDGGSLYRSENNFGSSSSVPGVERSGDDRSGGDDAADGDIEAAQASSGAVDAGDPSEPWSFVLLGLIAVAAVGLGVAAVRARR